MILSLNNINRDLPEQAVYEAISKLKSIETGSLEQKNELFMNYLQNGISVRYFEDNIEKSTIVKLIDYENIDNNDFQVINQWTIIDKSTKRPDIVVFVNGLPLVVIELKSPSREEVDASFAYRQLKKLYERDSFFICL